MHQVCKTLRSEQVGCLGPVEVETTYITTAVSPSARNHAGQPACTWPVPVLHHPYITKRVGEISVRLDEATFHSRCFLRVHTCCHGIGH